MSESICICIDRLTVHNLFVHFCIYIISQTTNQMNTEQQSRIMVYGFCTISYLIRYILS